MFCSNIIRLIFSVMGLSHDTRTYKTRFFVLLIISFSFSCDDEQGRPQTKEQENLFTILSSQQTGIDFVNPLRETLLMNGLFYEYFYNGGGVAAGDFNQDDLPDIYFISNLKPNKLFLNLGDMKFTDATVVAGLQGKYGFPTGVTTVDINADGKLDIYICKSGKFNDPDKRRNELYVNQGNNIDGVPIFREAAAEYGLDLPHFSTQASFFDYDLDGDLDMFLINHGVEVYNDDEVELLLQEESVYRGERLFRNDQGKFVDVTRTSGVINNKIGYGLGVAIGDFNNDLWPDVYISNDYSEKDHLYINDQKGAFKEVGREALKHVSFFSMGNDAADFNNDGWLDIVVVDMMSEDNYGVKTSMSGMNPAKFYRHVDLGLHHQYMYNTLQLNNGIIDSQVPQFSDIAQLAGAASTDWSWAPLLFDMDNDGWRDLFISNGIKRDFRNNDFVNYRKKRQEELQAKIAAEKELTQQDKENHIRDIMSKMPTRKNENYFFRNNGDLSFQKMEAWSGTFSTNSNGAAYADFDNDGDVDIVVNNSDDPSFIYQNNSRELSENHFIKVSLKGMGKNSDGIGARISIKVKNEVQVAEHYLTRGFQSSVSRGLHFGLGPHEQIDELEVVWPGGRRQILKNVDADQVITLDIEDSEAPTQTKRQKTLFTSILLPVGIDYRHVENKYDDYARESLLPHKMSQFGPALATGDVNGDGLFDLYLGGAQGYSGMLYVQNQDGSFSKSSAKTWFSDKACEDLSAQFFDADLDGDEDLYVVSGGNEFDPDSPSLQDRLYLNEGAGEFSKSDSALPAMPTSGAVVSPADFDNDGDTDLFIGGRLVAGKYPTVPDSYLLRNEIEKGKFKYSDVTEEIAPALRKPGMVTDARWADMNGDGLTDLVLVGEWMPVKVFYNQNGIFKSADEGTFEVNTSGWWFSVEALDYDRDGDVDLIAGNLGNNYKYKASQKEPFEVYGKDFDENGTFDIVLGYYNQGNLFPLRGRECSSGQMPFIKEKFSTYDAFGKATLDEVYGDRGLEDAVHHRAYTFSTTLFENIGNTQFIPHKLPNLAQVSSVNDILVEDFDSDGFDDLIIAGNLYASEVETPRNDAGIGLYLKGDGEGRFTPVPPVISGLCLDGDVKKLALMTVAGKKIVLAARNNDTLEMVAFNVR